MANITIGRFPVPTDSERAETPEGVNWVSDTWESWIEPEDRSWILYVDRDGSPTFYVERDERGGVVGEPVIGRRVVQ
jgi:hypothetical protein